jgi:hypothetical protein
VSPMRKSKSKSKTAKKSLRKKAASPARSKSRKVAKKAATRRVRKGYDSQSGRPTGRDANALVRRDELTREYVLGGMDEVSARQRATAEMRDNNKRDWRRG